MPHRGRAPLGPKNLAASDQVIPRLGCAASRRLPFGKQCNRQDCRCEGRKWETRGMRAASRLDPQEHNSKPCAAENNGSGNVLTGDS
ncbi:unnamed protein product [Mycena citricolor]|uniref:Uncharacterized protein n=1 Tax=Mycena citricolor TaxID=2018698 RepID=A0AAD2HLM6_9AGAR|nr:unnamed protein product [Mycena citricolor]